MEQLQLPGIQKHMHRVVTIVSAAVLIAAVSLMVLFYFLSYTKDQFVELYPENTALYVSIGAIPIEQVSALIARVVEDREVATALTAAFVQAQTSPHGRIASFGLVPVHEVLVPVFMIEQPEGYDQSLLQVASKNNWHVYSAQSANNNRLVLSRDQNFFTALQSVSKKTTRSLGGSVTQQLALSGTMHFPGTVYVSPLYLQTMIATYFPHTGTLPFTESLVAAITALTPNITLQSDGYVGSATVSVPHDLRYAATIHNPLRKMNQEQRAMLMQRLTSAGQNPNAVYETIARTNIILAHIEQYTDTWLVEVTPDHNAGLATIRKLAMQTLPELFHSHVDEALLDGTTIQVEKRGVVNETESTIQTTSAGTIRITEDGATLRLTNAIDQQATPVDGCLVNPNADLVSVRLPVVESGPILSKLAKFLVFSTYPQTYTQFSACLVL